MKLIKGFNDYSITKDGQVFSHKTNRFKKQFVFPTGYVGISLYINKISKNYYIHRLVAETYLTNIESKCQVNHINGIKSDNRVENLEWVTQSENAIHAIKNGLFIPPQKNRLDLSKEVYQYDLHGKFIAKFPSVNEASRITGILQRHISSCARGGEYRISGGIKKFVKTNSASGYKWHYQEVKQEILAL